MKTTIEALQNTYVKLGGELSDVANIVTIPDMIDAINTLVDAGGSGGSGALYVEFIEVSDDEFGCDVSFSDIQEAFQNDTALYAVCNFEGDRTSFDIYHIECVYPNFIQFSATYIVPDNENILRVHYGTFKLASDNTVTYTDTVYPAGLG